MQLVPEPTAKLILSIIMKLEQKKEENEMLWWTIVFVFLIFCGVIK